MSHRNSPKGFTLVELLVTVSIFVFMTALMLAKYGNFNQSVLLTNLAYDVALTIRTAQTYGISVRGTDVNGTQNFSTAYGVDFNDAATPACDSYSTKYAFAMFADSTLNGWCDTGEAMSDHIYHITRGDFISALCTGSDENNCSTVVNELGISFLRPNPEAKICSGAGSGPVDCTATYARITISAPDNSTRTVSVRSNGQISVGN
ncbi:prepilin-type N-terminal cleavage/methylation domain-containing protein [Patescibacteria group bacterium]|nr:prepilin-type N-terminal cleavage/methylation domain-containing protein [Patescibacteria group bacterium]MDE1946751.1 prepilin-type N-terminal cleavage/methylation domain-containing protein [Patescibacteria group bacterium]MDE2010946.1 prepilin-type N-terminal cleavage/methylation domain-containing protein [Patescibacteria group bacterium]MDE2233565.1 prepilin-type N-terminal cleavage/methylation domain-containing protein [Patescibacteria group bacterium]